MLNDATFKILMLSVDLNFNYYADHDIKIFCVNVNYL